MSLRMRTDIPISRPADSSSASLWESLDIILYNLAGKYESRYEGDTMLVELVDMNLDLSEVWSLLRRYRERGTLRVRRQFYLVS